MTYKMGIGEIRDTNKKSRPTYRRVKEIREPSKRTTKEVY